jgi:hypothetical protein
LLGQQRSACIVGRLTMLFQSGLKQLILNRHPAQEFAVGKLPVVSPIIGRRKYVSDFQPTARANDYPTMTRITDRVDGRKAAYLTHRTNAD